MSRRLGSGGGTVLPGHIVPRIDPSAIHRVIHRLPWGVVLVSGTNGKTTTARIVAHIASAAGLRAIHNRSGANLMTGIVSAIATHTDLRGRPSGDIGLFEVDEATVPAAVRTLQPRILALTNVFRDQLDRYGEVDLIAQRWRQAVAELGADATLVLNADDPTVARLSEEAPCRVLSFGIEDESIGSPTLPHEADRRLCPVCGCRLRYTWSYYSHVGHYGCTSCGWRRPTPDLAITRLAIDADGRTEFLLEARDDPAFNGTIRPPLPGLYNAYNVLAAATVCRAMGISAPPILEGLGRVGAVFGRQELVPIGSGLIVLTLVKNPVGFNQVLHTLSLGQPPALLVIAINDLFADGTDISWLWDVDFELLAGRSPRVFCAGLRAYDMAVRLKYALLSEGTVEVEPRLDRAVEIAVKTAAQGQRVHMLPTYTAMLAIRRELQRRGWVAPFWED